MICTWYVKWSKMLLKHQLLTLFATYATISDILVKVFAIGKTFACKLNKLLVKIKVYDCILVCFLYI